MKKIGILGGTFDPPHIGHLMIANEVGYKLNLDKVLFIPTKISPHKSRNITAAHHRLKMLELAVQHKPSFQVDTIELERDGISYSVDTVNELLTRYPDTQLYFIIGADMVEYLPKWHKIDELMSKIKFVGVNRLHYTVTSTYPIIDINIPFMEVSSTAIRKKLTQDEPVDYFLPEDVITYIKERGLYENE